MTFNGLPLHPLIVHVVVVFAPMAALGGIVYAVKPAWRWWLRWPFVASAVIAAGAGVVAVRSGYSLEHMRHLEQLASIQTHRHRGSPHRVGPRQRGRLHDPLFMGVLGHRPDQDRQHQARRRDRERLGPGLRPGAPA